MKCSILSDHLIMCFVKHIHVGVTTLSHPHITSLTVFGSLDKTLRRCRKQNGPKTRAIRFPIVRVPWVA